MTKNDPRKALGKGLHSLLPNRNAGAGVAPLPDPIAPKEAPAKPGTVTFLAIDAVQPNPDQPRREFDPASLLELTQSIEHEGVIQPIIARRMPGSNYQIIAGERRWRAAKDAGLKEIPVILRQADDRQTLELALIENIQREDLNPIELAQAFHRMASDLGLSHDQIGAKTSKDRATVTNTIRLLQLPEALQKDVSSKKLSPGHARALLKITDEKTQIELAQRCIREGWSVRQVEEYTRPDRIAKTRPSPHTSPAVVVDPNVKAAITEMEHALGTRVRIMERGKNKGSIEIEYYSSEDLDRIYGIIVQSE